jgi:hypothetical protein
MSTNDHRAGSETGTPAPGQRLQSLDACRGLIMFTLLCGGIFQSLIKLPAWHWLAVQNEHVEWAGCVYGTSSSRPSPTWSA